MEKPTPFSPGVWGLEPKIKNNAIPTMTSMPMINNIFLLMISNPLKECGYVDHHNERKSKTDRHVAAHLPPPQTYDIHFRS